MNINKAVILAGGRGTRFLPYTKAVCKELLAVVDVPAISLVVDECVNGGIKDILIIISPEKDLIKRYYAKDEVLEAFLTQKGKVNLSNQVAALAQHANISYVYQQTATGSGAAVLLAEQFCNGEAAVVLNADDYIYTDANNTVVAQLRHCYSHFGGSILGVQSVPAHQIAKYASCDISESYGNTHKLLGVYEKPTPEQVKTLLAPLGRYVISHDFFDYIRRTPVAANGELQFTDAFLLQAKCADVYAYEFSGIRYDLGDKLGYLKAVVEQALRSSTLGAEFAAYLADLTAKLNN